MAYNVIDCGSNIGNTGLQDCVEDFGGWDSIIECPADAEIDTQANAILEATWVTKLNAAKNARFYKLFSNFIVEPNSEEPIIQTGTYGDEEIAREGKSRLNIQLKRISLYNHKELRTHNGQKGRGFYVITKNGYILGRSIDETKFLPIPLTKLYIGEQTVPLGETFPRTQVQIEWEKTYWNDQGVWVKPTAFDPSLLDGVKDVRLSGTVGVTGMTLRVAGAADDEGFAGLIAANFNFVNDSAPLTPIAVTVATDNLDGTYVLTWADQTGNGASTFTLFDQPIGTNGAEAINSLTATL